MKTKMRILLGAAGLLLTASVQAEPASRYEFGTVLESHPIMEISRHQEPRQQCWDESVVYQERRRHQSATGTILGGIIGAAIGNKVGHGKSNKRVGAVAGAVLGATIGNDVSRKGRHGHSYQAVEQRCRTVYDVVEEERVVGYKVKYRYAGHTYTTETAKDPGSSLRLKVSIEPME